jgi:hypothetical protein
MKRYLFIAAGVVVILGIGAIVYFYFFSGAPKVTVAPGGSTSLPSAGGQGAQDSGSTDPLEGGAAPTTVSPRLVQISRGPVVPGMVVLNKKPIAASSTPETIVNYIERRSGNVYTYSELSKKTTRISNKTLPGIQSAAWTPDGSTALVRYLSGTDFSTINTYALRADGSAGFFLAQNISDISVSSSSLLILASGVNGSTASVTRIDGTSPADVFTTPLSALRSSFAGKGQYLAFTKPSGSLLGSAFLYGNSGRFSRIAGPSYGLAALASPSGKWVLVSSVEAGMMQMSLVDSTTHETITLPVATIADKCAWTADDTTVYCGVPVNPSAGVLYPDDWYQGAIPFNDRVWKINVAGRYAELVLDFSKETGAALDATALSTDPRGTTLVFINKNDGSLWSYSL